MRVFVLTGLCSSNSLLDTYDDDNGIEHFREFKSELLILMANKIEPNPTIAYKKWLKRHI